MSIQQTDSSNFWRRVILLGSLGAGSALALAGCQQPGPQEDLADKLAYGGGWSNNGGGWSNNGGGWSNNGGGWSNNGGAFYANGGGTPNGGGANSGGTPNAGGQNGLGWNGLTGDNQQYKGIGWYHPSGQPARWNGPAWGGAISSSVDCAATGQLAGTLSTGTDHRCTTLHNAINHTDIDGNGTAGDKTDKAARLSALAHWVTCACSATVSIPFQDLEGGSTDPIAFNGSMGLAPTWCGADTAAVVPDAEMQYVSACMMALQNTSFKHYNLSLRASAGEGAISPNEKVLMWQLAAQYWGNLWKDAHIDDDKTSCNAQNPSDGSHPSLPLDNNCTYQEAQGGPWWNKERFSCRGIGVVGNLGNQDQQVFGRQCEIGDCGGAVEWLGICAQGFKRLASATDDPKYAHVVNGTTYYESIPAYGVPREKPPGGLTNEVAVDAYGSTLLSNITYRGAAYRAIQVFQPLSISVEDPLPYPNYSFPDNRPNQFQYQGAWAQIESGTIPASQSVDCVNGAAECQGITYTPNYYRKLLGLTNTQVISLNHTGYLPQINNNFTAGDGSTPVTLAIRYQRPACLGDKQCDPERGCSMMQPWDCASGVLNTDTDNSCKGTGNALCTSYYGTTSGRLEVSVMSNREGSTAFVNVHGNNAPYGKNIFPPTGINGSYGTAFIYPIYLQNSYNTISNTGYTKPSSNTSADTVRVLLKGSTSNYNDAPQIDTAYFMPGTPLPDMDCTGPAGCWLYAGPNQNVALLAGATQTINLGQAAFSVSPILPAGTYYFELRNVAGDLDLHVNVNAPVSTTAYVCRPYLGPGASETCKVKLDAPGYFSVMVRGFTNQNCTAPSTCTCTNKTAPCAATGTVVGHN